MQITLENLTSPTILPRIWLRSGQRATVGRTEAADFALPGDERLSGLHFALDCRTADCRIRDLNSRNGTYVNSQRVEEATLHHGDVVLAGTTEFSIQIDAGSTAVAKRLADHASIREQPSLTDLRRAEQQLASRSPMVSAGGMENVANSLRQVPQRAPLRVVSLRTSTSTTEERKLWLRPGQSVIVGADATVDYSFPQDRRMSGRHFQLSCDSTTCRIRDLSSSNGTYLNRQRITEAVVQDGDDIQAGGVNFRASIEFDLRASGHELILLSTYSAEATPSQLISFRGGDNQPPLHGFLQTLRCTSQLYLIISPMHADMELQSNGSYLFDWLPRPLAARSSPVFLPPDRHVDLLEVSERLWTADAALVVVAQTKPDDLLTHLQMAARGQNRITAVPEPALMWNDCRPSQLLPQLAASPPDYVKVVFSKLDALIAMAPGSTTWQALGSDAFTRMLTGIGQARQRIQTQTLGENA